MSRDQISLPAEVERLEHADAGHDPHVAAVGDRRGRRHVLFTFDVVAARDRALPEGGALVSIDRPKLEAPGVVRRRDVEEDGLAPDDGRRAAVGRQRQLPRDVLGRRSRRRAGQFPCSRRRATVRANAASCSPAGSRWPERLRHPSPSSPSASPPPFAGEEYPVIRRPETQCLSGWPPWTHSLLSDATSGRRRTLRVAITAATRPTRRPAAARPEHGPGGRRHAP